MSTVGVGSVFQARRFRLAAVLLSLGFVLLGSQPGHAQPGPLTFFKNYFVTGDYVAAGVGLRGQGVNGLATGSINISASAVPPDADIVAAYLYWQVVTTDTAGPDSGSVGVKFRGAPLSIAGGPFGKVLSTEGTAPCWASGGSTGSSGGSKKTYTYRADVLRYFDLGPTGKPVVNGSHSVSVPDSGSSGNATPLALGAGLLVIYRKSGLPLSAIVIYDGGYTLNNATPTMSQTIQGFYQSANGSGKLTHMVGSGQANKSETILFNGAPIIGGSFGAADGPSWDTPTYSVSFDPTLTAVTTGVNPASDCLTWGAVVFKTEVKDTDGDGLLDIWESSTSPILDPNGQPLPNLAAMGANPLEKDLFIEIGYMKADLDASYGGTVKPAHSHLPSPAALKLVGDAFANAPVGSRVRVHFDVGDSYQDPAGEANPYLVPAGLARGGEAINEIRMPSDALNPTAETAQECVYNPSTDAPWRCQFSAFPGTVGWKTGFRFFRDQVIGGQPAPAADAPDPCDLPGNDGPGEPCERRFDRNRKDIFHYALFAHALGLAKSDLPCVDGTGQPVADVNGMCAVAVNPLFRTPRTTTGVGDFSGGDVLVTLGGFNDHDGKPVGTPFMQASTLMHELGHNLERRHGGEALEPNCKPTYLSVMNYLYQLRGLLDDSGKPHLDFSGNPFSGIQVNETSLTDGFLGSLPYRIGWYAPIAGSIFEGRSVTAALKHCDGSDLVTTDVPMVRVDARTAGGAVDWNANGVQDLASYPLDVNFSGRLDGSPTPLVGSDDWSKLRLNQVGARRAIGGLFIDRNGTLALGPLSLYSGRSDYGRSDYGRSDYGRSDYGRSDYGSELGRSDYGRSDYGRSDYGRSDYGRSDYGRGDDGRGDLGGGDLFVGNPYKEGELDAETAGALARTPPNEFSACVLGAGCSGTPLHAVRLGWTAPNVGSVLQFEVYRVSGDTLVPGAAWTRVGDPVSAVSGQVTYSLVDTAQLTNGAAYTYFAVARYTDGIQSDPSNLVTITAVNDPATAGNDDFGTMEDTPLNQPAPGVLANDKDPDTPATLTAVLVAPPTHGTLSLNPDGSFSYVPQPNFYGTDLFTYKAVASYGSGGPTVDTNVATVFLTVSPVNDAPVAAGDSFTTAEDTTLNQAAPGVLANDTDIDSPLTAALAAGPSHGTLTLNSDGSFRYTPAPNYNGTDSFAYIASDGALSSPPVTVTITVTSVNDAPTISDIADRTIDWNTNTGAVAFTVGDPDGLTGLTLSSSSSNPTLVPAANIVLGGSGSARTVTVTPAPNQYGVVTIAVQVTDATGLTASDSFVLTVRQVTYSFFNVQNAPPPAGKTSFKAGSAIPMKWQFKNGATVVNSSLVGHSVTVRGPLPSGPVRTVTNTDPGNSSFQYDPTTNTWQFNLQTKDASGVAYPLGDYEITITPSIAGYSPSPTFQVKLVK